MQTFDLAARQIGAGGIVGVGQENDACLVAYSRQQSIDIRGIIIVGRFNRRRAATPCGNVLDREAELAKQNFIAWSGKTLRGQIEQFVGTSAADNPRRI